MTGTKDDSSESGQTSSETDGEASTPPEAMLDNMEDADEHILPVAGRNGVWRLFTDGEEGSIVPSATEPFTMTKLESSRDSSQWAACIRGMGFSELGASMYMTVATDPESGHAVPWDASAYTGVRFWMRAGSSRDEQTVFITFSTMYGDHEGGVCSYASEDCVDYFTERVDLTQTWALMEFEFAELSKLWDHGGGPIEFDQSEFMGIDFRVVPDKVFDFCVDDVEFYGP